MTVQHPEILRHRGRDNALCSTPLWPYFVKSMKWRKPKFAYWSTACVRGYVGTWAIEDDRLWLLGLDGVMARFDGSFGEVTLAEVLPRFRPPVLARWFTGELRCVEGAMLSIMWGFGSTFERDRLIRVERGVVQSEWLAVTRPTPLFYRIEKSGARRCVAAIEAGAAEQLDPHAGLQDDELRGYLNAQEMPSPEARELGYFIPAATTFARQREVDDAA